MKIEIEISDIDLKKQFENISGIVAGMEMAMNILKEKKIVDEGSKAGINILKQVLEQIEKFF